MTSYVFEGTEVRKTGRRAQREVKIPGSTRIFEVIEITPVGDDFDWKKWVKPEELYEIVDDEPETLAQLGAQTFKTRS